MAGDGQNSTRAADPGHLGFNHPLFLHPSDTQATLLVSAVLIGSENYPIWSRSMRIALLGRNKYGFVDGSCARRDQPDNLKSTWDRCNAVVLSWLINSVDKSLCGGISFSETAKFVWDDLKERFDKSDGSKTFSIHRAINTMTQGNLSVAAYYSKLKDHWEEFDSLVPLPSCECRTSQQYTKIVGEQRLFQFLMGLNESYSQARNHVLMLSPLPAVNHAFSMISQHETHRSLGTSHIEPSPENTVMFASNGRGGRGRGRTPYQGRGYQGRGNNQQDECSHCHRKGYKKEQCFHIIGFPANWRPRLVREPSPRTTSALGASEAIGVAGNLTAQQYEQLLRLLQKDSHDQKKDTPQDLVDTTVGAVGTSSTGHLEWDDQGDW